MFWSLPKKGLRMQPVPNSRSMFNSYKGASPMSPGWSKSSIRLKQAQDNDFGIQKRFNIQFDRHRAEVLVYHPYGKGRGQSAQQLSDGYHDTLSWVESIIEELKQSLKQAGNAQEYNGVLKRFSDHVWEMDGVVRIFYDI